MLEELLLFLVEAVWCVAFPLVHTLKVMKTGESQGLETYKQWTYYWILYASLGIASGFLDWLPGFAYLRILLIAYLAFPQLKGSVAIYALVDSKLIEKVKPTLSALFEQVKAQH